MMRYLLEQATQDFVITGLAPLVDCAETLLSAPQADARKEPQAEAMLEESITKAQQQQRLKSMRTMQNEILKQVRGFGVAYVTLRGRLFIGQQHSLLFLRFTLAALAYEAVASSPVVAISYLHSMERMTKELLSNAFVLRGLL